jgi:hypothetical protein
MLTPITARHHRFAATKHVDPGGGEEQQHAPGARHQAITHRGKPDAMFPA